ncbi:MAG TPA: hypothetical protein VMJ34_02280 [Bryobacteraceae bacterium]|nr:hypothetical protein [Bryobacteraceae bacterium]
MTRNFARYALTLALSVGAQAATINTTLTVNATASLGASITATGTANLTNVGNGTFNATLTISASANLSAPFTITLTTGDKLNGTLSIPASILQGGSVTGSATIDGGTGAYAGAKGSFPSLTGSGGINGLSLTLTFSGTGSITTSGGGGGTPTGPTITAVQDAGSYTNNIAQGSIFVVKGTTLSSAGFTQMSFPLPTVSSSATGSVKVTFTPLAGGLGTDTYLVYLYNQSGVNQLAAVLPSTVTPGPYNVTVTNNGTTSAPFATQVVQRKPGLITADSSGSGLAVVQNYISASQLDINRLTTYASGGYTFSPAKPGQVEIAWLVGMGAAPGADNTASPGYDFTKNGITVQVIVGNTTIPALYGGRAPGLAGADQINFQLPANVQTGCTVPFQVSVGGQLSQPSYIAIAPDANTNACVLPGFTSQDITRFDQQSGSYTVGNFSITQLTETVPSLGTVKIDQASGALTLYNAFHLAGASQARSLVNPSGACSVIHTTTTSSGAIAGGGINLDVGQVTLTGPTASKLSSTPMNQDALNNYSLNIGTEGVPSLPGSLNGSIVAGTYTLNAAGGKDANGFSTNITLGSPLTVTGGLPSNVNRSAGLTLNWTGGNSNDLVEIYGSSSSTTGTGSSAVTDTWAFICTTTAGKGTFTVGVDILTQLPAVTVSANGSSGGSLSVASTPTPSSFSTTLKPSGAAIDSGAFSAFVGTAAQVSYQ